MKFLNLLIVLQLIPFGIPWSDDSDSSSADSREWNSEYKGDQMTKFTFIGSGPCRVEGVSEMGKHAVTFTAGTLADCAEDCLEIPECLGLQYRYTDNKKDDCALFKKSPTHTTESKDDRTHVCYMKNYRRWGELIKETVRSIGD